MQQLIFHMLREILIVKQTDVQLLSRFSRLNSNQKDYQQERRLICGDYRANRIVSEMYMWLLISD